MASDRPKREAPRFSKIDRRIWNDAKFRALSRPAANAQTLWFWLLTTDESTNIPGLLPVGRGAIAEILGWSQKAFDKCFAEIEAQGMARADWDARLVWVPKAIRRNPPENPNVVRSWWKGFDDLPECGLLEEAKVALRIEVAEIGKGFVEAFDQAITKTSAKECRRVRGNPSTKGIAFPSGNQEQEQEQEQEYKKDEGSSSSFAESPETGAAAPDPPPPPKKRRSRPPKSPAAVVIVGNRRLTATDVLKAWDKRWLTARGSAYPRVRNGAEATWATTIIESAAKSELTPSDIGTAMDRFFADPWWAGRGDFLAFASRFGTFTVDQQSDGKKQNGMSTLHREFLEAEIRDGRIDPVTLLPVESATGAEEVRPALGDPVPA